MAIAADESRRLASLTVIEPGGTLTKIRWGVLWKMIAAGARPTDKNLRKLNEWLNPGVTLTDAEFAGVKAALGYVPAIGYPRMFTDERLATITAPTLGLFGSESVVADATLAARRLREAVPTCETEIFAGAGHGIFHQIPAQVTPRILDFTRRYEPTDARRGE